MNIELQAPLFNSSGLSGLLEVEAIEPGFIDSLILEYEKNYVAILDEAEKAFLAADFESAEMNVHSLKSSSAVLGLARAAWICGQMEEDARNRTKTKFEFTTLKISIQQSLVELKSFDKAA